MAAFLEFDAEPDQEPADHEADTYLPPPSLPGPCRSLTLPPPAGMPQWATARAAALRPGRSASAHPMPPPPEAPGLWSWIDLMSGLLATLDDAQESWWAWVRAMLRSLRAWGTPLHAAYRHVVRTACQSSVTRGPHWRFWGIGFRHRQEVGNPWENDIWPYIIDDDFENSEEVD